MVNSEEFTGRLQKIIDYYELSAATFAEAIDVGRSSISHIVSGRNKPSLDFVMKIVQKFPEVELYWLLNGKGHFPSSKPASAISRASSPSLAEKATRESLIEENSSETIDSARPLVKNLIKVVLFYDDGTFEAFEN